MRHPALLASLALALALGLLAARGPAVQPTDALCALPGPYPGQVSNLALHDLTVIGDKQILPDTPLAVMLRVHNRGNTPVLLGPHGVYVHLVDPLGRKKRTGEEAGGLELPAGESLLLATTVVLDRAGAWTVGAGADLDHGRSEGERWPTCALTVSDALPPSFR